MYSRTSLLQWLLAFGSLIETVQANFQLFHAICVLFQPALFFQVVCRPCPAKWSSLQKTGCIFTWRKNCFKMTSLQKASASNMIFTYHYVSTMSGEPTPFFCINQLFLSALYVTQAPSKSKRGYLKRCCHLQSNIFQDIKWLDYVISGSTTNSINWTGACASFTKWFARNSSL